MDKKIDSEDKIEVKKALSFNLEALHKQLTTNLTRVSSNKAFFLHNIPYLDRDGNEVEQTVSNCIDFLDYAILRESQKISMHGYNLNTPGNPFDSINLLKNICAGQYAPASSKETDTVRYHISARIVASLFLHYKNDMFFYLEAPLTDAIADEFSKAESNQLLKNIKEILCNKEFFIWTSNYCQCPALLSNPETLSNDPEVMAKIITSLIILSFRFEFFNCTRNAPGELEFVAQQLQEDPAAKNKPRFFDDLIAWSNIVSKNCSWDDYKNKRHIKGYWDKDRIKDYWNNCEIIYHIVDEYLSAAVDNKKWFADETSQKNAEALLTREIARLYSIKIVTEKNGTVEQPLEEFYLDLDLKTTYKDKNENGKERTKTLKSSALNETDDRPVLIEGVAGQGKSTIMKKLFLDFAKALEKSSFDAEKPFPFFFSCAELAMNNIGNNGLLIALEHAIKGREYENELNIFQYTEDDLTVFRNARTNHPEKCIFFFDGLDEISPDNMKNFLNALQKFNANNRKVAIFLSSRPGINHDFLAQFQKYSINELSDELFSQYIKNLVEFKLCDPKDRTVDEFIKSVKEKEEENFSYKHTSRVPFILNTMLQTYFNDGKLPNNYIDALDTLVCEIFNREVNIKEVEGASLRVQQQNETILEIYGKLALHVRLNPDFQIDKKTLLRFCREIDSSRATDLQNYFFNHNLHSESLLSVHASLTNYFIAYGIFVDILNNSNDSLENCLTVDEQWREITKILLFILDKHAPEKLLISVLNYLQGDGNILCYVDYDNICQSIEYLTTNKLVAKKNILTNMAIRGAYGILHYEKANSIRDDAGNVHFFPINPYDELFYYAVYSNDFSPAEENYLKACSDILKNPNSFNDILADRKELSIRLLSELKSILQNEFFSHGDSEWEEILSIASSPDRATAKFENYLNEISPEKIISRTDLYLHNQQVYCRHIGHCNVCQNMNWGNNVISPISIAVSKNVGICRVISHSDCNIKNITVDSENPYYSFEKNCFIEQRNNELLYIPYSKHKQLSKIYIPERVEKISSEFIQLRKPLLREIVVDPNNRSFYSKDNCLIQRNTNTLVLGCESSIIPDDTEHIGTYAFWCCLGLKKISIPKSVKTIDNIAFCDCNNLKEISFADDSELTDIGSSAFAYCNNLPEINLPKKTTKIESYAFWYCDNLTTVILPESLLYIEESAFRGCRNLEYINIPPKVEHINNYAFRRCKKLHTITIPKSVTEIGNYVFQDCIALSEIKFEEGSLLKDIGIWAFVNCQQLKDISIPDSVSSLKNAAFEKCSNLTCATIGQGITDINKFLFHRCINLTHIALPDTLRSIRESAFHGCSNLPSISIPDSVNHIGYAAFCDCDNLHYAKFDNGLYLGNSSNPHLWLIKPSDMEITSFAVHFMTKGIADSAFDDCKNLKIITLSENIIHGNNKFENIEVTYISHQSHLKTDELNV